jgi:hypothetical protein
VARTQLALNLRKGCDRFQNMGDNQHGESHDIVVCILCVFNDEIFLCIFAFFVSAFFCIFLVRFLNFLLSGASLRSRCIRYRYRYRG